MAIRVTLAAAQTVPVRGDIEANLEQHRLLATLAADEGAALVVFPELSLTGYELDLAADLAFSENDPRLAPLVDLAAERSLTIVAGAPVRLGEKLHIGAFIIGPDRSIDIYTKHYLGAFSPSDNPDGSIPPAEASVFEPGDRSPLLALGERTAAIAVCADVGRPQHAQAAADRGANVFLASMFVIPSDFEREVANLTSYAVRHSMTVVIANFGGPSGGLPSAGQSAIWSSGGVLLAQLPPSGAGIVIATEIESGWRAQTQMLDGIMESH